jgi:proline iminopeptidase
VGNAVLSRLCGRSALAGGVGIFFPEPWDRFRDGIPEAERSGSLLEAYHRLLMNPDPAIHEKAAW